MDFMIQNIIFLKSNRHFRVANLHPNWRRALILKVSFQSILKTLLYITDSVHPQKNSHCIVEPEVKFLKLNMIVW
jgi:hypothetical protein